MSVNQMAIMTMLNVCHIPQANISSYTGIKERERAQTQWKLGKTSWSSIILSCVQVLYLVEALHPTGSLVQVQGHHTGPMEVVEETVDNCDQSILYPTTVYSPWFDVCDTTFQ